MSKIGSFFAKLAPVSKEKTVHTKQEEKEVLSCSNKSDEVCSKEASEAIQNTCLGSIQYCKKSDEKENITPDNSVYFDEFDDELTPDEKQEEFEIRSMLHAESILSKLLWHENDTEYMDEFFKSSIDELKNYIKEVPKEEARALLEEEFKIYEAGQTRVEELADRLNNPIHPYNKETVKAAHIYYERLLNATAALQEELCE